MALTSALLAGREPAAMVQGFDHCLFGPFRGFDTFDATERQRIYDGPASFPADSKLIAGHFAFSTLRQAYPRAQIFTVLRDPISRLLSHWMFWRQQTDAMLMPLGSWADFVRHSRKPLASFLNLPALAFQLDNLTLRMLLWPHPLIKDDQFIDPANDQRLISDAARRLRELDFVDVIENPGFLQNLEDWMGHSLRYDHDNETRGIPIQFRNPLHLELTPEAYQRLILRSRLDLQLWQRIVNQRLPACDAAALRERTTLRAVARYGPLMDANSAPNSPG